ncbi:hypothetical protein BU15DRAFT_70423 [Melanogaster broomeanus]|nr:hypothetical protein BU15DRAFT_70423 [Melanogaster broomeanus]
MSIEHDDEPVLTAPWVPDKTEEWKEILRPAMISQLLAAHSSPIFDDRCLMIEGRGFGKVIVVAHVARVEVEAAKSIYLLDDGTGQIRARKVLDSVLHRLSDEKQDEERAQSLTLEHTYVEVTGAPWRPDGGRTGLELDSIRPVNDYHHVMYHVLNAIYANVLIERHVPPYNPDQEVGSEESMVLSAVGEANLVPPPQGIPATPVAPRPPTDERASIGDCTMSSPPSTPISSRNKKGKERAIPHEVPEPQFEEEHRNTFPDSDTLLLESSPMEIETAHRVPDCGSTLASAHTSISSIENSQTPCTVIGTPSTPVRDQITRMMSSDAVFPNVFTPRKRDRYAALDPLAKAIIEYMRHVRRASDGRDKYISITEMGQALQASHDCTKNQFDLTIQELLSEAYITSPLDDGFVVITPRR